MPAVATGAARRVRLSRSLRPVGDPRVAHDRAVAVRGVGDDDRVLGRFDLRIRVDDRAGAITAAAPCELVLVVIDELARANLIALVGTQLDGRSVPALSDGL